MSEAHIPVLLSEVVEGLCVRPGGTYVDGTFGRGGYSRAILAAAEGARVIGLDRDPEAIAYGEASANAHDGRLTLRQCRFSEIDDQVSEIVDGVAFDLGVSSPQLDDASRGFSFREDGPLDMRMGDTGPTAADIVNTSDESDLADIFYHYGEERRSRAVARAIVAARLEAPITRTAELATLIRKVVKKSKDGIDPATRSFQGLRIAVNEELQELDRGLAGAERVLKPGGRLAVVSFHSLEDRAVKRFLAARAGQGQGGSRHLPQSPSASKAPTFRLIGRKPIAPSADEIARNPRARSARLRVAERTEAAPWNYEEAA